MGGLSIGPIPDPPRPPNPPNRGAKSPPLKLQPNQRPQIEHIMLGRRAAWSPLWWWPCFSSHAVADRQQTFVLRHKEVMGMRMIGVTFEPLPRDARSLISYSNNDQTMACCGDQWWACFKWRVCMSSEFHFHLMRCGQEFTVDTIVFHQSTTHHFVSVIFIVYEYMWYKIQVSIFQDI